MSIVQALVLGIAQGLGEFLPISSSAHLILIPWLFRWHDPGLTFDIALHLGTLLAVVIFFWKDWVKLIAAGMTKGVTTPDGKLFWFLVVASVPGAAVGALLEEQAETVFRNPLMIGIMLIVMGLILFWADRCSAKRRDYESVSLSQSLIIGLSQAFAIIPGVSRSGVTMTSALFLGLAREDAARFSFLLSTPIVAGAGLLKLRHLAAHAVNPPFMVGVLASAVVGILVIGLLLRWLRRNSFRPFVWYRLILGAAVITIALLRR